RSNGPLTLTWWPHSERWPHCCTTSGGSPAGHVTRTNSERERQSAMDCLFYFISGFFSVPGKSCKRRYSKLYRRLGRVLRHKIHRHIHHLYAAYEERRALVQFADGDFEDAL